MSVRDEWRWTDEDGVQRLVRTDELREAIENHVLPASTLVWREGMKQWAPASTMPELSAAAKKAALNRPSEPEEENQEDDRPNKGDRNTPTAVLTSDADGPTAPPRVAIPRRTRAQMSTLVGVQVPDGELESAASSTGAPIIVPPTSTSTKGASITIPPKFTPPPPPDDDTEPPAIPAAPKVPAPDDTEDTEDDDDDRPTRQKDVAQDLSSMEDDSDTLVRASELDDTTDGPPEGTQPAKSPKAPVKSERPPRPEPRDKTASPKKAAPSVPPKKRPQPSRPPPPLPAAARGRVPSRPPPPKPRKEPSKDKPSRPAPPRRADTRTTAKWPPASSRNAPEPLRNPKSKRGRPKPPKPPSIRPAAPTADVKVHEAPAEAASEAEGARVNTLIGGLKPKKATTTPHPRVANTVRMATEVKPAEPSSSASAKATEPKEGRAPRVLPNLSDEDDTKTEVRPDELRAARAAEQADERAAEPPDTGPAEEPQAAPAAAPDGDGSPAPSEVGENADAPQRPAEASPESNAVDSLPLPPRSDRPPPSSEASEEVSVPPPAPVGFASESGGSVRPSTFPHLRDPVSVPMSSLVATGGVWVLLLVSAFLVGRCTAVDQPPPKARAMLTQAVRALRLPQPQASPVSSAEPKPCWVTRQAVKWAPKANKSVPFGLRPTDEGTLELGYAVDRAQARGLEVNPKTGKATELFSQEEADDNAISLVTPLGSSHGGFVVSSWAEDQEKSERATTLPVAATPPFFLTIADEKISISDSLESAGDPLWNAPSSEPVTAMRALNAPGAGFGLTFRQEGTIWTAWLGADRKPVGELTKVAGSGGKVGRPKSGWNNKEFAVIFADKPEDAEHWQIRVGHAPTGSLPTDTVRLELPEGGPGGDAFAPDLAGLPDGRWLFMWTEGPGPGERAVRAQTLTADFTPIGDPIALSPPAGSFGQAVLGVVGTYTTVVFLSQGDEGFELWGAVLQCG